MSKTASRIRREFRRQIEPYGWEMIQRVDADRVEHRQTDDARQRNVCPAARGLERRRRTVPKDWCETERVDRQGAVRTCSEAYRQCAAGRMTADDKSCLRLAIADVLNEVGNVGPPVGQRGRYRHAWCRTLHGHGY